MRAHLTGRASLAAAGRAHPRPLRSSRCPAACLFGSMLCLPGALPLQGCTSPPPRMHVALRDTCSRAAPSTGAAGAAAAQKAARPCCPCCRPKPPRSSGAPMMPACDASPCRSERMGGSWAGLLGSWGCGRTGRDTSPPPASASSSAASSSSGRTASPRGAGRGGLEAQDLAGPCWSQLRALLNCAGRALLLLQACTRSRSLQSTPDSSLGVPRSPHPAPTRTPAQRLLGQLRSAWASSAPAAGPGDSNVHELTHPGARSAPAAGRLPTSSCGRAPACRRRRRLLAGLRRLAGACVRLGQRRQRRTVPLQAGRPGPAPPPGPRTAHV